MIQKDDVRTSMNIFVERKNDKTLSQNRNNWLIWLSMYIGRPCTILATFLSLKCYFKKTTMPILCLRGNCLQMNSSVHTLYTKQILKQLQMPHSPGIQPLVWSPFLYGWIEASDLFLMSEIPQKWWLSIPELGYKQDWDFLLAHTVSQILLTGHL